MPLRTPAPTPPRFPSLAMALVVRIKSLRNVGYPTLFHGPAGANHVALRPPVPLKRGQGQMYSESLLLFEVQSEQLTGVSSIRSRLLQVWCDTRRRAVITASGSLVSGDEPRGRDTIAELISAPVGRAHSGRMSRHEAGCDLTAALSWAGRLSRGTWPTM